MKVRWLQLLPDFQHEHQLCKHCQQIYALAHQSQRKAPCEPHVALRRIIPYVFWRG